VCFGSPAIHSGVIANALPAWTALIDGLLGAESLRAIMDAAPAKKRGAYKRQAA
jgi:hypothetical protein